ncbi:hypothetical protein B0H14DRAFT_2676958 [Mycena olivaceomarginata]|nr:hypothetical protein B0H14DRAFT_2676958 [Mycena olivaceomarginata]
MKITYDELPNNVSTSIFPIFEEFRPTTYILPNLQHLTWKITSPDNLDRAALFLTPELQGLVLHLGGVGTRFSTLPAFLADLGSRMKLQSFSINSSVGLPDTFTELLLPQDRLEKLGVVAPGALSPAVGKWVASLPCLKSLQLDLSGRSLVAVNGFFREVRSGASTPDSVESHTDSGVFSGDEVDFTEIRKSLLDLTGDAKQGTAFSALTQLQLTGQVASIVAFLTHLSSPLTQLDITIEDPPDAGDWRDLSAMIGEKFGSSLTSLRVAATLSSKFSDLIRSTSRSAPAQSRLSLEHLSPLPVLRTFSIDLPESICFTPIDIAHLADMAPNMEEVRLCPLARFAATPPQLTLESLAPLVKNCRRLYSLAVVINAKPGAAEPSASSNSLIWLHVGHSWVADTLQVGILLSQFAPYLETIKWFTERNRPGFIEANARAWQKREVVVEYVEVAAPRPPMTDKAVDATVLTVDCEVDATPPNSGCVSVAIDATPQTVERHVEAIPETTEMQVDATRQTAEAQVDAVPRTAETQVDATTEPASVGFTSEEREIGHHYLKKLVQVGHSNGGDDVALDTLNVRT